MVRRFWSQKTKSERSDENEKKRQSMTGKIDKSDTRKEDNTLFAVAPFRGVVFVAGGLLVCLLCLRVCTRVRVSCVCVYACSVCVPVSSMCVPVCCVARDEERRLHVNSVC